MTDITWTNTTVKLGDLKPWADNPRTSSKAQAKRILKSFEQFGQAALICIDPQGNVLDGHQRLSALLTIYGDSYSIEARRSSRPLTDDERRGLVLALANATGSWNWDSLSNWSAEDLKGWGMDADTLRGWKADVTALGEFLKSEAPESDAGKTLAERFGVPPFSVLDARQGYWQERKAAWIGLGIESEIGRGDANPGGSLRPAATLEDGRTVRGDGKGRRLTWVQGDRDDLDIVSGKILAAGRKVDTKAIQTQSWIESVKGEDFTGLAANKSGTSIFDPVLCELAYLWFCPPFGQILDPFAGGSVRGIVASYLAYHYIGIDLRHEQIEANEKQAQEIVPDCLPVWMEGDSRNLSKMLNTQFDFIFSCPPYFDLEVYSEDEKDLSNAGDYDAFITAYRDIICQSVAMLKDNRFACFVVGDIRDKKGFYRNFPADTIAAFEDAGMTLYNEAILVTAVGSLPIRISKQFGSYRKLGKTHQNVLVFYKGDPKAIKTDFGEIEVADLPIHRAE